MSFHTDVRAALETHLANMPGVPAIAWEDVRFDPPSGQSWLRVTLRPVSTEVRSLYDPLCMLDSGLFLIDVFTPENSGPRDSDILADALRDRFKPGTQLSAGVNFVRCAGVQREGGFAQPPWRLTPFTVRWWVTST